MRMFGSATHAVRTPVTMPVDEQVEEPAPPASGPRPSKWEVVGVALTGVGVLLMMFLVYVYAFTGLTGVRNQNRLSLELSGNNRATFSLASGRLPAEGRPVALLDIPSLHVHQVVVNGTSAADLQQGPGLMVGTALPGEPGNAVIAGRRVTYGGPFRRLAGLSAGTKIKVTDGAGSFTFRVVGQKVVSLGARYRVGHTGDSWLTLVTSNSSFTPGGEVVLLGRLVGTPALSGGSSEHAAPSVLLSFGGDPAAGGWAGVWAFVFLALLAATLVSVRWWRQPVVSYILAAPVLLACGLFVCENLARCLPATL
jgi:sortase A